jgi:hypothetical protein
MLFKAPQAPRYLEAAHIGGGIQRTTWWDRTNTIEELPASGDNLEFAIGSKADRMVQQDLGRGPGQGLGRPE